jgi:RNA polymerase sigma factor (sigma-70 family)
MTTLLQNISPGLIQEAQLGNKGSLDRLTELVRDRLFAYIYRLTLDYAVTQDILQETMLFMVRSITQLEHVDRFWHWLFRTALGKVQHHYRDLKRRKTIEMSDDERRRIHDRVSANFNDGLTELLRKELSDAMFKAMGRLNLKYRNVLVLRCYENLEHSEIALMMNISEMHSRVLFFRAKNSLRRQLAARGFGRRYLLVALAIYGIVTTSAKAATSSCTITTASLETGITAPLVAMITSKIGLGATAAAAAMAYALPFDTFLCVVGIACLAGVCGFFLCLFGIYNN